MSQTETRQRLLEIALELIWQSNYNSVGVNEICKQAGVTKGAFYYHFESKASLFCEATTYYWQVIKVDLDAMFSPANNALEQLENVIHFLTVSTLGNHQTSVTGCPFYNVGTQIGTGDEHVMSALQSLAETAIKYNTALVQALQAGDFIEPHEDAQQLARLMYQYIHGVMSYIHADYDSAQQKQDLSQGLYRLLGLKRQYWYTTKPTWQPQSN